MSLVHNGEPLFDGQTHGDIVAGPYTLPLQIGSFFQVIGEFHIVGGTKGRDLSCEIDALGYETIAELKSAITSIQSLSNRPLIGTLVIQHANGESVPYPQCTFSGLNEIGSVNTDALTGTYWQKLVMIWRQSQ